MAVFWAWSAYLEIAGDFILSDSVCRLVWISVLSTPTIVHSAALVSHYHNITLGLGVGRFQVDVAFSSYLWFLWQSDICPCFSHTVLSHPDNQQGYLLCAVFCLAQGTRKDSVTLPGFFIAVTIALPGSYRAIVDKDFLMLPLFCVWINHLCLT